MVFLYTCRIFCRTLGDIIKAFLETVEEVGGVFPILVLVTDPSETEATSWDIWVGNPLAETDDNAKYFCPRHISVPDLLEEAEVEAVWSSPRYSREYKSLCFL